MTIKEAITAGVFLLTVGAVLVFFTSYMNRTAESETEPPEPPTPEIRIVEYRRVCCECSCGQDEWQPADADASEPETTETAPQANEPQYNGYNAADVTQPSGLTAEQLTAYLERFPELQPTAPILAENDAHINAVFALAVLRLESGNGRYAVRPNNLGSIKCFYTGDYMEYDSIEQGAEAFIRLLRNNYLDTQGRWYNGLSVEDIRTRYCPTQPRWTEQVAQIMAEIDYSIRSNEHE